MADWDRFVEIIAGRKPRKRNVQLRPAQSGPYAVISKITHTIEMLDKRVDFLLVQAQESRRIALKKHKDGDKQLALSHLRTAKSHEKHRESIIRRKDALVSMRGVIEESEFTKIAFDAIKATHTFLKATKMPKLEEVDQMVEDIITARDEANQILSDTSTALEPVYDEDELERELDELLDVQAPSAASATRTPNRDMQRKRQDIISEDPSPFQKEDEDAILLQQ